MSKETSKAIGSMFDQNRWMDDLFKSAFSVHVHESDRIVQKDGICTLELEVPGVKREDVQVAVNGGQLVVIYKDRAGESHTTKYDIRSEYSDIKAKLADGILSISFTLTGSTRRITVE